MLWCRYVRHAHLHGAGCPLRPLQGRDRGRSDATCGCRAGRGRPPGEDGHRHRRAAGRRRHPCSNRRGRLRRGMSTGVPTRIELPVEGMSCASCASRIERKLNRLDGVHATVNYATERATVEYDPALAGTELIADTIEQTGYHAGLTPAGGRPEAQPDETTSQIARRLWVSAALTAPVLALAMIPPLQFDGWQWFSLLLATIVVGWGGLPFHRATLANLRHGTATMDTLI